MLTVVHIRKAKKKSAEIDAWSDILIKKWEPMYLEQGKKQIAKHKSLKK